MTFADLAVICAIVVIWALLSRPVARLGITEPMVFVTAGCLLGAPHVLAVNAHAANVRLLAEVTLVLVLFADASRVGVHGLRHDPWVSLRLLGVGLPLTILAGVAAGVAIFSHAGLWSLVLLAATLAPTDASLGAAIVTDPRLPARVRRALNVESGLNDGIVAPLVAVAISVLGGSSTTVAEHVRTAVLDVGVGTLFGVAIGSLVGFLVRASTQRSWTTTAQMSVGVTATALACYAGATALHGNGFIAAFVGGFCFGGFHGDRHDELIEVNERTGQLLSCVVWYIFGAALLRPALDSPLLGRALIYAVCSLTVVRILPVAISLVSTRLGRPTTLYIGWFGPRGLASVVFALLATDSLGVASTPVVTTASLTVALSVLVHGLSANPLTTRYVRSRGLPETDDDHPLPAVRRGLFAPPAVDDER